jgi:hypothetical protein
MDLRDPGKLGEMKTLLLLLLVSLAVPLTLALLVGAYALYRRAMVRTVLHPQLGELLVYGAEANARLAIGGQPVDVQLSSLAPTQVEAALALPAAFERLRPALGEAAIAEWRALGDAFDDDPALAARLTPLLGDPAAFAATFAVVGATVEGEDADIAIELLSPWDPEHTYLARLDRQHGLAAFGLTCAAD